jgi:hypothetical protein
MRQHLTWQAKVTCATQQVQLRQLYNCHSSLLDLALRAVRFMHGRAAPTFPEPGLELRLNACSGVSIGSGSTSPMFTAPASKI